MLILPCKTQNYPGCQTLDINRFILIFWQRLNIVLLYYVSDILTIIYEGCPSKSLTFFITQDCEQVTL